MTTTAFQIGPVSKMGNRVEISIHHGDEAGNIFVECDDVALVPYREAPLALSLFPAMKAGAALQVEGEVSARMLGSLPALQEVYHSWFPDVYQQIEIENAIPVKRVNSQARRVGVFFSGGADSWYTLIKNRDIITDLILVWGFDIMFDQLNLFNQTRENIQKVAEAFGKNLVVVKTNLRDFTQPQVDWNWMYGATMSAVGHLLSGEFCRVYTSAGQWYAKVKPAASHVLLDSHWSSESLEVEYVGLEASRLDKVRILAQHEIALQTLRVCWKNPNEMYNCGKCEKCLRTMVALQAVGALERCPTFPVPIDTRILGKIRFLGDQSVPYTEENLHALEKQPWNRKIYNAERRVLLRHYFKNFLIKFHSLYPRLLPRRIVKLVKDAS